MIWQASTCAPLSDSPSCVQRSSTAYSSAPQRTTTTATPSTSTARGAVSLTASALPISTHRELMRPLKHPCLQARGLGHHGLVPGGIRSEEHTSELQSQSNIVCR